MKNSGLSLSFDFAFAHVQVANFDADADEKVEGKYGEFVFRGGIGGGGRATGTWTSFFSQPRRVGSSLFLAAQCLLAVVVFHSTIVLFLR